MGKHSNPPRLHLSSFYFDKRRYFLFQPGILGGNSPFSPPPLNELAMNSAKLVFNQIICQAEGTGLNTDVPCQGSKTEGGICCTGMIEGESIFNSPIKRDLGFAGTPAAGSLLRCDRLVRVGMLFMKLCPKSSYKLYVKAKCIQIIHAHEDQTPRSSGLFTPFPPRLRTWV
jgi:hypothetical protein